MVFDGFKWPQWPLVLNSFVTKHYRAAMQSQVHQNCTMYHSAAHVNCVFVACMAFCALLWSDRLLQPLRVLRRAPSHESFV